jgi:hypothetical protein
LASAITFPQRRSGGWFGGKVLFLSVTPLPLPDNDDLHG